MKYKKDFPRKKRESVELLKSMGVRPSKLRGQNFLESPSSLNEIIEFAGVSKGDKVYEIGPGLGVLTNELARNTELVVIELESEFCRHLENKFPQIKVVESSVLQYDFPEWNEPVLVIGNLPYSLSTSILFHCLAHRDKFSRAVFLLQKEFVERLGGRIGTSDYGVLAIMVQSQAVVVPGPIITGDKFHPVAKVDSQVVELRFKEKSEIDFDWLHTVVQASFHQRRKKILNGILSTAMFSKDVLLKAFEESGIDPNQRPENVTIEQYQQFAAILATCNE
jgi:16S rRNA (adenine1518-N6/adenine1519-N6)-dimethyltransferase